MRVRALLVPTTIGAVLVAGVMLPASPAVAAKKKKFKVTASASAATVKTSHNVTISGKVTPASKATVKLQRWSAGKWVTIGSKKLSKASKYAFTTNVGKTATTLSYRVSKAKSKTRKAAVSKTVKVKVITWGTVKAWGYNSAGELGRGNIGGANALTAGTVKGLSEVTAIEGNAAGNATYALRRDGTVWAWGENSSGELGRGTVGADSGTPAKVTGLTAVKAVAATQNGAFALRSDGTVWAWGDDGNGQFGTGAAGTDSGTPRKIAGLSKVKAIGAAEATGYAVKTDGTLWAWGSNSYGELGRGNEVGDSEPIGKVPGLSGITSVTGGSNHAFAVGSYGLVYSWGYNGEGELGRGTEGANEPSPALVVGLSGVTTIGTAFDTTWATSTGGTLWGWGSQSGFGLVGNGSVDDAPFPVRVSNLVGVRDVEGGYATGYALLGNGTVRAWGAGTNGQLGNGLASNSTALVTVKGVAGARALAGTSSTGYALLG